MTYSRDYPDVDPSVHPGPITHRECTGPFLLSSLFLFLFPSADASIIVAPTIFHRSPFTRKKSPSRLKSHSAVWDCKTRLFVGRSNGRCYRRNSFRRKQSEQLVWHEKRTLISMELRIVTWLAWNERRRAYRKSKSVSFSYSCWFLKVKLFHARVIESNFERMRTCNFPAVIILKNIKTIWHNI